MNSSCPHCGAPLTAPTPDAKASRCPACGMPTGTRGRRFIPLFLVVVVLFGVLVMIAGIVLVKHIRTRREGDRRIVETPFGSMITNEDSSQLANRLHIPVYPGSRGLPSNVVKQAGEITATVEFESLDSVDQVVGFYQRHIPGLALRRASAQETDLHRDDRGVTLLISVARDAGSTHLSITEVIR